ncbi:MAG: AraC family transcriptional regulator [Sphaerochaeta sp.]|jgi:AraC-like DNA-binding protein|nr:AraC family transcriptional regulator [Spirochaetales bacterium]
MNIAKREIVFEPTPLDCKHLSAYQMDRPTFLEARMKEGGYGRYEPGFFIHRIPDKGFHAYVLSLSGRGIITMDDGTELHLGEGELFISAASGQGHLERTYGTSHWEHIWFTAYGDSPHFQPECTDYQVIPVGDPAPVKEFLLRLFDEEAYNDTNTDEAVDCLQQLFMIAFRRCTGVVESSLHLKYRELFTSLWSKVSSDPAHPWTVERLAEEVSFSRSQFSRLCQQLYNKSPGLILTELRMRRALVLIRSSSYTMTEIAERVGYNQGSNFSAGFRSFYGYSPRTARSMMHRRRRSHAQNS